MSSKTPWTPGPWWAEPARDEYEKGRAIIAARTDCGPLPGNPTRGMVAFTSELLEEKESEYDANARLIAAAPDLARALIASEAARKLAEERLREAKLAFENVDAQVEDEGEFTERSWEQLRANLKEIDNG